MNDSESNSNPPLTQITGNIIYRYMHARTYIHACMHTHIHIRTITHIHCDKKSNKTQLKRGHPNRNTIVFKSQPVTSSPNEL